MQSALTSELHSISPYLATASADKMTFLILVIVLFIALIVFMVLSAKKTHWMNLVGVFFVFVFAVFYMMMIPNVFKNAIGMAGERTAERTTLRETAR